MIENVPESQIPGEAFAFRGMAFRSSPTFESTETSCATGRKATTRLNVSHPGLVMCPVRELGAISVSIPSFAIWQIGNLERCFHRYCGILQLASRDVRFRRNCVPLMASAERISAGLELVRQTNAWTIFNRTAFELRQDCEQLAAFMA